MITIRDGEYPLLTFQNDDSSAAEIAHLHVAAIRRFREGKGFPVTFAGHLEDVYGDPAGQMSIWFHPGMTLAFDYGTTAPVLIDEDRVVKTLESMDSSELGVLIGVRREDGSYPPLTTALPDKL
ncbi:hypothetical protein MABM_26110 [Mycobacteroides abscessus]|uniref:DUF7882 family protein n=1 Tax=Mycobacteroides abscessus TaxID=36809 RepID=UPI0005A5552E|nr:hypothetical protein [Mycobacteroides abscessus]BBZ82695.1 hypothetical protein MABM_26110 [Mycobacteroides abscessus]